MAQKKKKKKSGKKVKQRAKKTQNKKAASSTKVAVVKAKKPEPAKEPVSAKEPEKKPGVFQKIKDRLREKAQERKRKELARKLRKPIIIVFSILALFVLFYISSIVVVFSLYNRVLPGTSVAGADLSSLTLDEAQNKLMERGQPFLDSTIPVVLEGKTINFAPGELGISLLPRNTLQEVKFVNFNNTNIFTVFDSMARGRQIPFYVSVDIEKAQKSIEEKFEFGDKKSKNAYLAFEGKELAVVPEQAGKAIDSRTLYKDIKGRANELSSEALNVTVFDSSPLVTKEILEGKMEGIKDRLYEKIKLEYESWSWDVKLADHMDWVKFEYRDSLHLGESFAFDLGVLDGDPGVLSEPLSIKKELKIKVDQGPFLAYVKEEISPTIESESQDVSIYKNEEGKIIIEGKGENGQTIKTEYLTAALELAVNSGINKIPIPVHIKKAKVTVSEDLQELGIQTLVGTGRSAFAGSPPNRVHNINVGVNKYNGLLIPPGETFSFNEFVGPVDAAGGYLPELVIKPEGTIPEYGGGLCQVSSTIYRAALMAGLPIVQRAPHSYAVSYYAQIYGYGLDATIYIGVHDVRFTNDTPGHILIQAYTEGVNAYFKFYGTDDGRTVELEGPYLGGYHGPGAPTIVENPSLAPGTRRQVENAHTGFNATWYRHMVKNGEQIKETIYSAYRAIPAKIMVGPVVAEE